MPEDRIRNNYVQRMIYKPNGESIIQKNLIHILIRYILHVENQCRMMKKRQKFMPFGKNERLNLHSKQGTERSRLRFSLPRRMAGFKNLVGSPGPT